MPSRVLLLQSDDASARPLKDYFSRSGAQVWGTARAAEAESILRAEAPDLVLLDLHLPGNEWLELLARLGQEYSQTQVIITNKHPDYRRELLAKQRGASVFLRQPFTPVWIERALSKLERPDETAARGRTVPRVRLPMRLKITLPYALLALIFAIASAFLISRYILESLQDRFTAQLIDVGKLSADWMVQEEDRLLESMRLLANMEGVAQAILDKDADRLHRFALPVAVNYQEEAIHFLDMQGTSLLTLVHQEGGAAEDYTATSRDPSLAELDFVQEVLKQRTDPVGNKYAGLLQISGEEYFAIAGPVSDEAGRQAGVVIVAKTMAAISQQIRTDTLAQVTFYRLDGQPMASTFLVQEEVRPLSEDVVANILKNQDRGSSMRELKLASASYTEIMGPWEARGGSDLGLVGASLAQNFLARPSLVARVQVSAFVLLAFLGVIALGLFLAHQITQPLSQIVQASIEVARGNLEVKVNSRGSDEVSVLAYAFNTMVSGLQEGFIYQDLLGRTVSPEVREALRRSFASGDLRLEGQNAVATVLMSDIRGFTALSEKEQPTTVLNWLNEYFGELVPIVASHGGVVDKFEGDAMLAFFGILPTPLPAQESANQACQAAVEMLEVIDRINNRRTERGEPPLITGISIHTGRLTAGSLGTSDRLNYTVIGDTVNTAQRMGEATREFGENGVVISQNTMDALAGTPGGFNIEPLGEYQFKGKIEMLWLYRLYPETREQGWKEVI